MGSFKWRPSTVYGLYCLSEWLTYAALFVLDAAKSIASHQRFTDVRRHRKNSSGYSR